MKIVFWDVLRDTRKSVDNVEQIRGDYAKIDGRTTKVWFLDMFDGSTRSFKQKDYQIERIEA